MTHSRLAFISILALTCGCAGPKPFLANPNAATVTICPLIDARENRDLSLADTLNLKANGFANWADQPLTESEAHTLLRCKSFDGYSAHCSFENVTLADLETSNSSVLKASKCGDNQYSLFFVMRDFRWAGGKTVFVSNMSVYLVDCNIGKVIWNNNSSAKAWQGLLGSVSAAMLNTVNDPAFQNFQARRNLSLRGFPALSRNP